MVSPVHSTGYLNSSIGRESGLFIGWFLIQSDSDLVSIVARVQDLLYASRAYFESS